MMPFNIVKWEALDKVQGSLEKYVTVDEMNFKKWSWIIFVFLWRRGDDFDVGLSMPAHKVVGLAIVKDFHSKDFTREKVFLPTAETITLSDSCFGLLRPVVKLMNYSSRLWPISRYYLIHIGKPQYLTTIPRARMGYESIEGRMGYWFRAHEGERNIIVLVKSN